MRSEFNRGLANRIKTLLGDGARETFELAVLLNVSYRTARRIIIGKKVPTLEQLVQISCMGNVTTDELLGRPPRYTSIEGSITSADIVKIIYAGREYRAYMGVCNMLPAPTYENIHKKIHVWTFIEM